MSDVHGLLIIDKPRGITSHDVVARVRRLLKTRKVGHAGTLDPAAEGVLVIAIGRATKLLSFLSSSRKRYLAHIVLGVDSVSGDIEGPAISSSERNSEPSPDAVHDVVDSYAGQQRQVPPAHSAIKVQGQPLYRQARRGVEVDIPTREVTFYSLTVIEFTYPDLILDVECSAGTYIRSLARDIGASLSTGAYLHYLLRVRSGSFELTNAWPLAHLERDLTPATFSSFALHPACIPDETESILLDSDGGRSWYDGRPVVANNTEQASAIAHAFQPHGTWLGVGEFNPIDATYQPRIVVHE